MASIIEEDDSWSSSIIDAVLKNGNPTLINLLKDAEQKYKIILGRDRKFDKHSLENHRLIAIHDHRLKRLIQTYHFHPTAKELQRAEKYGFERFLLKVSELGLFPLKQN